MDLISDIESINSDDLRESIRGLEKGSTKNSLLEKGFPKNDNDIETDNDQNNDNDNVVSGQGTHVTVRGWSKMSKQWEKALLSDSFVFKDVKGDGNCQFRAIELAFKINGKKYAHRELRKMLSNYILSPKFSNEQFKSTLNSYQLEQENGDFEGNWDPSTIKTKIQFAKHIKKAGFHFQGDNTTLSILSAILKVDFIILNNNNFQLLQLSNNHPNIIILLYTDSHYQAVGLKIPKSKVTTIFNKNELPRDLAKLIDKEMYLKEQVEKCWNASQNEGSDGPICNFTLNEIYNYLQSEVINRKLLQDERKIVANLLKSYVNLTTGLKRKKSKILKKI
jgi:hypothetical protein